MYTSASFTRRGLVIATYRGVFNARRPFFSYYKGASLRGSELIGFTRLLRGLGILRVSYAGLGGIRVLRRVGI